MSGYVISLLNRSAIVDPRVVAVPKFDHPLVFPSSAYYDGKVKELTIASTSFPSQMTKGDYFSRPSAVSQAIMIPAASMGGSTERFTHHDNSLDRTYLCALRSRMVAVIDFVGQMEAYYPWYDNWMMLRRNLEKSGTLTFDRLESDDPDLAYVIEKGQSKKIKIRGSNFQYLPMSATQYIILHECAHLANPTFGHGKEFRAILAILCLAAFECKLIDLSELPRTVLKMGGQEILSRADLKNEILDGIFLLTNFSPYADKKYYDALATFVKSF